MNLKESKLFQVKYLGIFYSVFLILYLLSKYNNNPHMNYKLTLPVFILLLIVGISIIAYYSKNYNIDHENIYRLAFIIVLCFGLFNVFLTPIVDVCDETEHFWKSELTSNGDFIPNYVKIPNSNSSGYETIGSLKALYSNTGNTVFQTSWDNEAINYSSTYVSSSFAHNPFYGYLAQGFGIDIAKILDLNNIWMLWLGRLCNLILYSSFCAIAIKKAPIFKIPLLAVACLPLAIYQGASMSIDAFVNGSSLLTIAYFLYMYKREEKSLTWKNILIFFILSMVGGLTKVPYLALSFLIFLVPKIKFKTKNDYLLSRFGILAIIIGTLLWTVGYATPHLTNSWRGSYFIEHHVNAKDQINYLIENPDKITNLILQLPSTVFTVIEGYFSFGNLPPYGSKTLSWLYGIFFIGLSLFYPNNLKISKKTRIGSLVIFLIIYLGIIIIQYLTWCSVGLPYITGIFGRYFIPLLSLIPIFLALNYRKHYKNIDIFILTIILSFIASSILLTVIHYY